MNGASAEPLVNTMINDIIRRIIIRGINQYFLRVFRKLNSSLINSITGIV
jgi:hypothetical protein